MVTRIGWYVPGKDDPSLACLACRGLGGVDILSPLGGRDYLPCRGCNDTGYNSKALDRIYQLRQLTKEQLDLRETLLALGMYSPKEKRLELSLIRTAKLLGKLEKKVDSK